MTAFPQMMLPEVDAMGSRTSFGCGASPREGWGLRREEEEHGTPEGKSIACRTAAKHSVAAFSQDTCNPRGDASSPNR